MQETAYRRHLDRAQALLARRMRACADGLPAEITRTPVAGAALRTLRTEVATTLARHAGLFAGAFDEALRQSCTEFLRPPAPMRPQRLNLGELEIMDDARVQEEIEVAQVVQILAADTGLELHRLLKFEAALRRAEGVRVAASPIGPPSLARALWSACEGLGLGVAARAEAVRCAAHWLAPRLSEIYAALRQSGFADASPPGAATDASANAVDEAAALAPPTGFDVTRPGALYELLAFDERQPVYAASAQMPMAAIADTQAMPLDGDDPRIPGLIHSHREELAALQGGASPRLVVALIAHLFDRIVADPSLSADARTWIGRLQPGVVRLATQDAALLQSHRHPAWLLVNRIATHLATDNGPPAPQVLQWLATTVAQVDASPTADVFEAAANRLTQWQRKQAQRRLTDMEEPLALLQRNASLEAPVARARTALQRRLDSAQPPSTVRRFLLTLWSLVCAQESATRAPDAAGGSPAMDAAVDLIWSTDAARSRADAPTLIAMMPGLVERLSAGMATVGVSDAIRTAWLDQLAAHHLKALRRPFGVATASAPITVDLALEDELPVAAGASRPADAASASLAELQVGDILGLQLHGDWMDLQLLWTSDNGQFLLFAGAPGGESHSFTRTALAKMRAQGLLRPRSVLQRASDEIIRGRH